MNWSERFIDAGITLVLSGALLRIFQPAVFDYVCYAISNRREKIKAEIREMFAEEIAVNAATAELASSHKEILEFIVESVKRTNEEMPEMVSALRSIAETNERLNTTCEKLADGQQNMAVALGRMEERSRLWESIHEFDLMRLAGLQPGTSPRRMQDHLAPPSQEKE